MPSQPWLGAAVLLAAVCSGPAYAQPNWQVLPQAQTKSGSQATPGWQPLSPGSSGAAKPGQPAAPQWKPMPTPAPGSGPAPVVWQPVAPGEKQSLPPSSGQAPKRQPPTSQAEAEALIQRLEPPADSYSTLIRLGQLPTANGLESGNDQIIFQQVSPLGGGAAGGSGNQNYLLRGDFSLSENFQISAYYTYADDPLYSAPASKPNNPGNLWTIYGGALKGRLAGGKAWQWAAEGALELFSVGSGCGGQGNSCTGGELGNANIFNNSGQKVWTRNIVGSLALPLSWQATKQLQLSLVPAVSWLPSSQGSNQGGAGEFFGTNISLGVGANYRPNAQVQLFGSAMVPLGPGNNSFDSKLVYSRTPILSLGTNFAVNPRIALEGSITNGFGLSPSTAILALPSAPWQPMLSGRFIWTPGAPDSKSPNYTARQASLALGGLSVNTALTPSNGTKQFGFNADSRGNLFGFGGVSVSNDFQFQVAAGQFNGISPQNSFISTYEGGGNLNLRFGGKAMVMRPTKGLPLWTGGRISVGRNYQASSYQGYLFFESMNTWEATPWLAFSLNPKLATSGLGTPWGVGIGANIQLGQSFQLIPEINAVATDLGGTNGTNGSLNLRWLANQKTTVDLYVSNAAGLLDMGQLLGNSQVRVGTKVMLSF